MVIAHNLSSMNATRLFGINTKKTQTSMEKLSSGFAVNRAADDAAGLAISEKMRMQIRGLNRASLNAQDGISVIQTAEGAFGEMQTMLHRINELCIQAANDTNTDIDRMQIQQEIDQLVYEIDDTTQRTQFNTKQILSGVNKRDAQGNHDASLEGEPGKLTYFDGKNNFSGKVKSGSAELTINETDGTGELAISIPTGVPIYGSLFGFYEPYGSTPEESLRADKTVADYAAFTYIDPKGNSQTKQAIFGSHSLDPTIAPMSPDQLLAQVKHAERIDGPGSWGASNYVDGFGGMERLIRRDYGEEIKSIKLGIDDNGARAFFAETWSDQNDPFNMKLQVGALSGQYIEVSIEHLNARGLGITGLFVDSYEDAGKSAQKVQDAIDKISSARANLGAQQNRLEHTIKNLDNVAENTQAAESRIRDTDMAKEMVQYTKQQILEQASQAMISNARRSAEGVLALLNA